MVISIPSTFMCTALLRISDICSNTRTIKIPAHVRNNGTAVGRGVSFQLVVGGDYNNTAGCAHNHAPFTFLAYTVLHLLVRSSALCKYWYLT